MLVDEYLDLLAQRSPEILELDPTPDYPVSVAAAWDLSLERIQRNNPGARQLLDICASTAPEPIPRSILRGSRGVSITPEVDPLLRQSIRLNRAVRDLSQFSLIRVDPRADTLQMHRLLQTVLLAKLGEGERERMRGAAHQLLSAAKPGAYGSSLEWPDYQALLPHVLASQSVTSSDTWVRDLVADTIWFLYYWGDHQGAADYAREAWSRWLAASGEEDIHVIRMTKSFSFLLRQTGQVSESIPLIEKALETSRRLEVEPEELIDSLCEMADARRYQGRMEEARSVSREATELARSLFGSDDPATLRATHSWGVDLRLVGEFREALPLDQENARLRDLLFGPASFFTLNTLNGLAIDMRESGDYPGARDFQEDVYRRARTAFGDEHPLTLRIARNLAVCRRRDGALAEAAKLTEETLRRFVNRYDSDHSDSLATATNLAVDRRLAGDLESSRQLGEDTVRRYEQRLGANHLYTLLTRANLAATLRTLGALDSAQEEEDEAARRLAETVGGAARDHADHRHRTGQHGLRPAGLRPGPGDRRGQSAAARGGRGREPSAHPCPAPPTSPSTCAAWAAVRRRTSCSAGPSRASPAPSAPTTPGSPRHASAAASSATWPRCRCSPGGRAGRGGALPGGAVRRSHGTASVRAGGPARSSRVRGTVRRTGPA
ncbi:FxSxx-COOH system tetratricopeptide repeat protein [Streptomyces thinghirensis]|nr:FxSxx-COOH system tetratricopeptide repeat protein [Streptomyces thinghirensis]